MKSPRIAFIGAGSYGFTFKLVADILSYDALRDCELSFMDVNGERLNNLKIVLDEHFRNVGYARKALYTLDLEKALEGADFVINLVKIGFLEASEIDMDIPKKFGLYQTIGDTCGVGGVFRGLRTMIYDIKLCRTIERVSAPGAVVLNYTNPQSMLVMAAAATSRIPFVGLCHSVQGTTRLIAKYLDVSYEELTYEAAGINHMNWILKLERNGEDLYPRFRQLVKERGIYDKEEKGDEIEPGFGATRLDMLNRVGYMVTESSTHFAEYVPYYLRTRDTREVYGIQVDRYKANIARKEKQYQGYVESARKGSLPKPARSTEYGSMIVNAMMTNEPCRIYANVMNKGLITNLPEFSAVEVACLVDRNGVQPCHYGALPTHLAALCRSNINVHQLAVEAVLNKDRKSVYWALMMDPATHSVLTLDQMQEVADALIAKHQEYLGEYIR
ncbi:MAG: alpha-galactosidase [Bacteroidota bacterium]